MLTFSDKYNVEGYVTFTKYTSNRKEFQIRFVDLPDFYISCHITIFCTNVNKTVTVQFSPHENGLANFPNLWYSHLSLHVVKISSVGSKMKHAVR
jgi:hypothetical protein